MIREPFRNEEESFQIDQLTIENRLDRIQLYGSVEITRDQLGLKRAKELQSLINSVTDALLSEDIPDRITEEEPDVVKNPFV